MSESDLMPALVPDLVRITDRVTLRAADIAAVEWRLSAQSDEDTVRVATKDGTVHHFVRRRLTRAGNDYLGSWPSSTCAS